MLLVFLAWDIVVLQLVPSCATGHTNFKLFILGADLADNERHASSGLGVLYFVLSTLSEQNLFLEVSLKIFEDSLKIRSEWFY